LKQHIINRTAAFTQLLLRRGQQKKNPTTTLNQALQHNSQASTKLPHLLLLQPILHKQSQHQTTLKHQKITIFTPS